MDLTTLSDGELDALQLAVNTEIGVRLQRQRMGRRVAALYAEVESAGLAFTEIDTAIVDAKTKIEAHNRPIAEKGAPVVNAKVPKSKGSAP